ncbi:DUF7146 domain-containing protein [Paracoccus sp. J56]|uniref:DUF7146 domain-containing protein n=1 Tax=Paracoccus sp. J56 TaxID=935850 RepID=UPI000A0ADC89|nr:toprim domain-containing protein [Paracoccus sp. J56]SMG55838.1 Toprim domain-containing protein [Paracoccus sp. J56]
MSDARTLTIALRGKWYGRYGLACCPAHNDRKPSLTIADGDGGHLLLSCKAGCAFTDVLDALRGLGLIEGRGSYSPPSPSEIARREAEDRAEAGKRERQTLACWNEAQPIGGTLAETYLRSRGITCDLPDTLRFHPDCWHPSARRYPALLARVDGAARFAVHRTYLAPDGSGKAMIDPPKAMLGAVAGGAVRLAEAQGPLVVCEGIETGLSLAGGLLARPATIWAALSTSGMAVLRLPDRPHRLTIATDGDEPGKAAGHKLAERASALGWTVSILPAPEGRDWNDILMMKGAAA